MQRSLYLTADTFVFVDFCFSVFLLCVAWKWAAVTFFVPWLMFLPCCASSYVGNSFPFKIITAQPCILCCPTLLCIAMLVQTCSSSQQRPCLFRSSHILLPESGVSSLWHSSYCHTPVPITTNHWSYGLGLMGVKFQQVLEGGKFLIPVWNKYFTFIELIFIEMHHLPFSLLGKAGFFVLWH